MIRDEVVEEVRARADIVGIIGEFVQLKKSGKEFKGLSPFKNERTPSFCVVPSKGFFKDFSSGESGDVFRFLMKHQGMSFVEAVKYVGARSGVEVRETRNRSPDDDPWRPYREVVAYANAFFQERLWEWEGGAGAREYLERRGIERETAEEFGLGYAPDEWRAFCAAAAVHGFDEGMMVESGLVKQSEKNDEPYDAFRDRVTFPIESESGRVLGFGGRLLGPHGKGLPKYLNSPESPLFRKGEVLYGMSRAKNHVRREGVLLLVEGYMDVVSLASAGIRNAVAPLGTAFTEQQADVAARYSKEVRLIFDSDSAGLRATFRAADVLLSRGLRPSVATLPDGEDPDSVARSGGAEAMHEFLRQSVDVLERKIGILEEREWFSSIERTRSALDRLLPTLRAAKDPKLRDLYLARVAERTDVRRETLEAELRKSPAAATRHRPQARARRPAPKVHGRGPERMLLLLLLHDRRWVEPASERIGPADLEDRTCRAIFEMLLDDPELRSPPEEADPAVVRRFEELMTDEEAREPATRLFEDAISKILVAGLDRRLDALDHEIGAARDEARKHELVGEKTRLTREKRDLGVDWRKAAAVRTAVRGAPS